MTEKAHITIVVRQLENGDVDSRAYDPDGLAIYGLDAGGEKYHLGQVSSSFGWAKHDMREHFKAKWDRLYPDGWDLEFECV